MSYEAVNAMFRMHKPPAGLVADLAEFKDEDGLVKYYTIRLYRENFDKLTQMNQFAAADWVQKTIENLSVVTTAYLEVWRRPGVPG